MQGIALTPQALGQALLRGRYTAAVARIERTGVPIDVETLTAIRDGWERIKADLIREVDADYGVFEHGVSSRACSLSTALIEVLHGPRLRAVACNLTKTHSAIKRRFTLSWRRCGSYGTHSASYGSKSWQSAPMGVTGPCSVRSVPHQAETLLAQTSSSSDPASGYEG